VVLHVSLPVVDQFKLGPSVKISDFAVLESSTHIFPIRRDQFPLVVSF
jgi:hypothetical protein